LSHGGNRLKIDINLNVTRKKKKQPSQDQDIVWPTMLGDDDPIFGISKLNFYDAGTKEFELTFQERTGDYTLIVTGVYMDVLFIDDYLTIEYTEIVAGRKRSG
jgi:hypothetical protein